MSNDENRTAHVLAQTFNEYDSEITAKQTTKDEEEKPKKKLNQNMLIFGVMGVASIAVAGYVFLHGAKRPPAPQKPLAQIASNVVNQGSGTQQNAVPVAPVVSVPQQVQVLPPSQPVVAAGDLNKQNEQLPQAIQNTQNAQNNKGLVLPGVAPQMLAQNSSQNLSQGTSQAQPAPTLPVQVPSLPPLVQQQMSQQAAKQSDKQPMPQSSQQLEQKKQMPQLSQGANPIVLGQGNDSQVVADLKKMFEEQTAELKTSIDAVGVRVANVEKRIAVLESKKSEKSVGVINKDHHQIKVKPAHHVSRPVNNKDEDLEKIAQTKAEKITSDIKSQQDNGSSVNKIKENVKTEYPEVKIHSIFSGRVWIKNADGSLSTYAEGEKLSDGELIKKIDDDKNEIITDKRVIN
jgi:flagellar basal body-associated protein FliL